MKECYLIAPFLSTFYLAEAVCRHYILGEERKELFMKLAEVFCIPAGDELEAYYRESGREQYRSIVNIADYERLCRSIEFLQITGKAPEITAIDRMIMAQKRCAMTVKSEIVKNDVNMTRDEIYLTLSDLSEKGSINAASLLAFLEYNGICVGVNKKSAIERIRMCAEWNDIFGCMMGLCYDKERSEEYMSLLHTLLTLSGREEAYRSVCARSGIVGEAEPQRRAEILEKAFGMGSVKRDLYDINYARVVKSEIISDEDKRKLLGSKQQETAALIAKIPFGAVLGEKLKFDRSVVDRVPLKRENELRGILRNIKVALTCSSRVCKPLMISSNDGFLTSMYADMIKAGFGEERVVELDAGNLTYRDFEPTCDHFFLRGMEKTGSARTVFIIRSCEELGEGEREALAKLLAGSSRKSFELYHPQVSLDLSGLILVLLSSAKNPALSSLVSRCETVISDRVKQEEKPRMIESVFASTLSSFGLHDFRMAEECLPYLETYDAKSTGQLLEAALRSAVYEDRKEITLEDVRENGKGLKPISPISGFGFNGGINNA